MSDIVRLKSRAEIDEEAAVWTWRLDAPSASAKDQDAFESWLREDPRHRRSMEEMTQAWTALDRLAEYAPPGPGTDLGAAPPRTWHTRWQGWASAAAVAAVSIGGALLWQSGREHQTLATAVGQEREVNLADGSVVTLNTNTIVETRFERRQRDVYLRKGEAHFRVAHDRSKPFLVHAGDAVVRAVGTEFEVRVLAGRRVDVVVNEGRVEVQAEPPVASAARAGQTHPRAVPLTHALVAGEELSASGDGVSITPVSSEQLASVLAWRDGAIVFDSEPLSEAIADIERYTDARIIISDPQIAALRVGGRYRTGNLQEFFDALQRALPVSVRHASNDVVYLEPR